MPFDILHAATAGLAHTAYERLTAAFRTFGHDPSEQQLAAIRDLLKHLEIATTGALDEALYLSPIPAGTGKTTTLTFFAETLMDSPAHNYVGMIVFVNRIAEARDMAGTLQHHRDKLCVITSDADTNALGGHATADEAQLVISTQAALKRTLKQTLDGNFAFAKRFFYHDERRAVVCWDEAFAFNRPVVLDADTVLGLAKAMRRQSSEATNTLIAWAAAMNTTQGLYDVPDFEEMEVDFYRLEEDVGDHDDLVTHVKGLAVISGNQGYVSRQGAYAAIVTHYPEIPQSMLPIIVTDASAKVNVSYQHMAQKVPVVWLKEAGKTYENLTIRWVNEAASRSVYRDKKTNRASALIDMTATYIGTVPAQEEVLVIGYKGRFVIKGLRGYTLREILMNRLRPEDQSRVHYLTYGNHTATNDYKHVKHVVLMGLNFMPKAAGHATAGSGLGINLRDEQPTDDQIDATQRGMLLDTTLQAVLRGNARKAVGSGCGVMEVLIPQSMQTGLDEQDYECIFPRCKLVEDTVLMPRKKLRGRAEQLSQIVIRRLQAGEVTMTNQSLYEEMGMAKSNFAALVKKPEWQAWVASMGLRPQALAGGHKGLRRVA